MVIISGLLAMLGAAVIATNELQLVAVLGVAFLAVYGVIAGRAGLRRGYNHRDRFLLIFGASLACALVLGLALNPFLSS